MGKVTIIAIILIIIVVAGLLFYASYMYIQGPIFTNYIALIKLRGTISYTKPFLGAEVITPDDVRWIFRRIINDPFAKAVVIVINSPGGSAAASEEIYKLMEKLSSKKVVVVYAEEYLTSGGYYISLPANKIIASPHAIVGSVGALAVVINVNRLLNKIGVNVTIIKSGPYKDVMSPFFRNMTRDDFLMIKGLIDKVANIFKERVLTYRPYVNPEVFNAGIYLGVDAIDVGLIDGIGTLEDAIKLARETAGLPPKTPVVEISKPKGLLEALLGGTSSKVFNTLNPQIGKPVELLMMWIPSTTIQNINATLIQ